MGYQPLSDEFMQELPAICEATLKQVQGGYSYKFIEGESFSGRCCDIRCILEQGDYDLHLEYIPVSAEFMTDSAIRWQDALAQSWAERLREKAGL